MTFRRKQRDLSELQSNPHFQFYVGRLVGAAEMTANWLKLQTDNGQAQDMGNSLGAVVGWFLLDDYEPAEAQTQILPPKP